MGFLSKVLLRDFKGYGAVGKLIDDVVFHAFQIFDLNQGWRCPWRDSVAIRLCISVVYKNKD